MKRELISILTALALVLSLCPAWAFAAEGDEPDGSAANPWPCSANGANVTAALVDGTLTITGSGAMADYDGLNLVAPWQDSVIATVVLEGVTYIGAFAFYNCTSLASVTIPGSVTSVGTQAFMNCAFLKSVTFQGRETVVLGMDELYVGAFSNCPKLDTIQFPHGAVAHYRGQEGIPSNIEITAPEDHTYDMVVSNGGGILDPAGQATRAETAQMLKNFMENQ